ncbi:efflux RND transporter permease subunit [bacterium]|nr:efflux RND transporter permease subunit [bacterium]
MNIAEVAIRKRLITLVLTVVLAVGGIICYGKLGRLEDPEFTIKDALVITPYPGATAREVEEEVSDLIERAAQALGQLKRVKSKSDRGLSTVTVTMKDKYGKKVLPQVWDELRRKVGDVQAKLPPGAGPSLVNDDYGDVYGVFVTLYGDGYSMAELEEVGKFLRRDLLLAKDVKRIELFGVIPETVYVEISRERLAQMGISEAEIYDKLRALNLVTDAGRADVGTLRVPLQPTGEIKSVAQMGGILISRTPDRLVYLRDIATFSRGYKEPPDAMVRFNGKPAIALGISTAEGGNVVTMGEDLKQRLKRLMSQIPVGISMGIISMQSDTVVQSVNSFVINLIEAVVIVIVVLLFFMGMRSGLIIGAVLLVTILGSFIVMDWIDVILQRISLGALIIALGMLVDNAIVVCEGMLIRIERGDDKIEAAREVVTQNQWPLLGATVIAIFAFGPIGLSQDNTGEYCRSLFQVLGISLFMSWLTAITVTPLLCVMFFKPKARTGGEPVDAYSGGLFRVYRGFLRRCLSRRWITVGIMVGLLAVAFYGFGFVDQSFFPPSTRPQFMVDLWLPAGTDIRVTAQRSERIEEYLKGLEHVTDVCTIVGQGPLRFLLTVTPEKADSSYMHFIVSVDDYTQIDSLVARVQKDLEDNEPDAVVGAKTFLLGPNEGGRIQARFSGPDEAVLRELGEKAMRIMRADPGARTVRTDWRERVADIRPVMVEEAAQRTGITRPQVCDALKRAFDGITIGVYREKDKLLSIVARPPKDERVDVANINNLQIWSPTAAQMIPLRQAVGGFDSAFEPFSLWRRNRMPTITVHCDQRSGPASVVFNRIRQQIEALPLPPGHHFEWGGEYEDSMNAQAGLNASIPAFLVIMVLVTIVLFNSLRIPTIIWFTVPFALIGVTFGLLAAKQPFGFMALLGLLSLSGMLIKNAIVLLDEINTQRALGSPAFKAVLDAAVSRIRPVSMAAATTVLGMAPLLQDAFFVAMAVAIMAGLTFATGLTLLLVPSLYTIFFRVKYDPAVR